MESSLGENGHSNKDAGKRERKRPLSPRIIRSKDQGHTSSGRAKTEPVKGELRQILQDIAKLRNVDFVKTYSRSRTPATRPITLRTMSTTTSPVSSPISCSPTSETPDPSRGKHVNLSRSLSLRLLTDRLKSGRSQADTSTSQSKNNIPGYSLKEFRQMATFGTLRRISPVHKIGHFSEKRTVSQSPERTRKLSGELLDKIDDPCPFPKDVKMESDESRQASTIQDERVTDSGDNQAATRKPSVVVTDHDTDNEEKVMSSELDFEDDHQTFVSSVTLGEISANKENVPENIRDNSGSEFSDEDNHHYSDSELLDPAGSLEDEGVCEDSEHLDQHSMMNEPLEKETCNSVPRRRSGAVAVKISDEVHRIFVKGDRSGSESPDSKSNDSDEFQPRKFVRRIENASNANAHKSDGIRFVTHPPQTKSSLKEEGVMDTNGLAPLKSSMAGDHPAGPGDMTDEYSRESLADSYIEEGHSDQELSFHDVMEHVISESSDSDKVEKRNGKSQKQKSKSKSDPSGSRGRERLDLKGVVQSSQSHSVPSVLGSDTSEDVQVAALKNIGKRAKRKTGSAKVLVKQISSSSDELKSTEAGSADLSEDGLDSHADQDQHRKLISDRKYGGYSQSLSPRLDADRHYGRRYGHATAPISTPKVSPSSGTTERSAYSKADRSHPYTLLLSVPPPKKPIIRSTSSASVLKDRRPFFSQLSPLSKDKQPPVRKYSATTDEAPSKSMGLMPEFGSSMQPAVSMPDVWMAKDDGDNRPPSTSTSPERETESEGRDKRYLIVQELHRNEQEYVDALKTLKDKYMSRLKYQSVLDETVVDNIFYMIPEILIHHMIFLDFLDNTWRNWDAKNSTVGNIITNIFSKQTVLYSYLSFVENYKTSGKVIEHAIQTKSSVQKFIGQCHRDSGSKLTMKDLIVRPIQRIPRYELLLQRLIQHTPKDHPDFPLLEKAEKVMHELAVKIGTANDGKQQEEDQQETLKKLEILLITDLVAAERAYIRHDMVQIVESPALLQNKKDQCCIWLFSDLILITSIKRKTGPVARKVSVILKTPTGQDFAENTKHKTWLRIGLDDIEIVKTNMPSRNPSIDKEQLEEDLDVLAQMTDLTIRLSCGHNNLDDTLKEMIHCLSKQLSDSQDRGHISDQMKLELMVTTQEGVLCLLVIFPSADKRTSWELAFQEAKQKLSLLSDKREPEFLQPLQITKTRAGMQFSCAAAIDGLSSTGFRDVWVCNSDGYVGHMCLLSLQPEPIVTLNTPVPGCNARILCICAVPSITGPFRRKGSARSRRSLACLPDAPQILVENKEEEERESALDEEGYQSDSDSSGDDDEDDEDDDEDDDDDDDDDDDELLTFRSSNTDDLILRDDEDDDDGDFQDAKSDDEPIDESPIISTTGSWSQEPHKSSMWLGTEDGCIHIFQCTDNIKTTKNKLKIQHKAAVHFIVYLDCKVFVSLANGDLVIYRRSDDGFWDTDNPVMRSLGTTATPVTKMLAVAGKLWCGTQNSISVLNPATLQVERSFSISSDNNRSVQCLVTSGQGVWIASQNSSRVILYHATTFEYLMEVSIAQAVAQKLQSADDIIRQHKAACLRITSLLVCKDLLWLGTSAGVVLTIPIPKITSTTSQGDLTIPAVTGLVYGHTGHVRFLTSVELPSNTAQKLETCGEDQINENIISGLQRRASMATTSLSATMATKMLVISGGDGYEDFRNNTANEAAGRDDSTNHLLLWQV